MEPGIHFSHFFLLETLLRVQQFLEVKQSALRGYGLLRKAALHLLPLLLGPMLFLSLWPPRLELPRTCGYRSSNLPKPCSTAGLFLSLFSSCSLLMGRPVVVLGALKHCVWLARSNKSLCPNVSLKPELRSQNGTWGFIELFTGEIGKPRRKKDMMY